MSSHILTKKPSAILAAIALAIVHRFDPHWVAVPLHQASDKAGLSSERLSRLATRAISAFTVLVVSLTRLGRPAKTQNISSRKDQQELATAKALLEVATQLLDNHKPRGPNVRSLLVGAYLRLMADNTIHMTQKYFCQTLSISERTMRSWLKTSNLPSTIAANPSTNKNNPPPKKPKRISPHGRFSLELIPPQTQYAGDTTDIEVFGTGLKFIALQDVGSRDQRLLEAVKIDESETAQHVSQLIIEQLSSVPGAQLIVDQGKPFIANLTQDVCDSIDIDLAVQKEGHPEAKATLERAFGSVKGIAQNLSSVTNRVAEAIPCLKQSELAKMFGRLLIIALLRAYTAGSRASQRGMEARQNVSLEHIEELSAIAREKARAEYRSKRLFLSEIYHLYNLGDKTAKQPQGKKSYTLQLFIKFLRTYPLTVLQEAEKNLRKQVHRGDIKQRGAYYAAIVRNRFDEWKVQEAKRRREKAEDKERQSNIVRCLEERTFFESHPELWLMASLENLSCQAKPDGTLLFDGAGIGKAGVQLSLKRLSDMHGSSGRDTAGGVFDQFRRAYDQKMSPLSFAKIESIFRQELEHTWPPSQAAAFALSDFADKLINIGVNQRPPPLESLRNYAARCSGS